jgi:hypothetical protein
MVLEKVQVASRWAVNHLSSLRFIALLFSKALIPLSLTLTSSASARKLHGLTILHRTAVLLRVNRFQTALSQLKPWTNIKHDEQNLYADTRPKMHPVVVGI